MIKRVEVDAHTGEFNEEKPEYIGRVRKFVHGLKNH